ncbi:MAG TPA: hypothetical protein DHW82_08940 [Spirochaetia bacterium]|nr:MAG: hypothetical protein A2Y41_13730 [Spirochaetes bacterium GWB1_36_13]HCL57116.1 hypothetical protein [Spirochaetia bacterium]
MNNFIVFFFSSLFLQIFSSIFLIVFRNNKKASQVFHFILLIGLVSGLTSVLSSILSETPILFPTDFPIPLEYFRFDSLAFYFLFLIQLAGIPITIFSYSYFNHEIKEKKSVKSTLFFYAGLLVFTQLVVVVNQAVVFLVFWELMSLFAYLGMIFEKEKKEVEIGSFYYFVMSHVVVFALAFFFFLLHRHTGSWFLSDFHMNSDSDTLVPFLYLLSIIGFGMKAGFIPFHFWLPKAHPIAPTVFSAFLSAVIIKTGIYGLLRTFQFARPVSEWMGWIVLFIGIISAVFGIWYAIVQKDIKKILAYSSVENIGIIGIGIGLGLIGSACQSFPIQVIGFGGALLHTLNHSLFKSLLFMGSGILYHNFHTRDINQMGGAIHRKTYFAVFFLIGSLAITGIPFLNGFISEFLIYNGFFQAAKELKNHYPLMMLLSAVALAFAGGLAVACFTKIYSIVFLGSQRTEIKKFYFSFFDAFSLGILALLMLVIGVYPIPLIQFVSQVLGDGFVKGNPLPILSNLNWLSISLIFFALLAVFVILFLLKKIIYKKYGQRTAPAWGCGYEKQTPRMQYTASSFSDELSEIPDSVLGYQKIEKSSNFPYSDKSFSTHSSDFVEEKLLRPLFKKIQAFSLRFQFFKTSDLRTYLLAILLMVIFYSLAGFLWDS